MHEPLFGKTQAQLEQLVKDLGLPRYTAGQMSNWLYKNQISSIDEMTNLSKKARELLKAKYKVGLDKPVNVQTSSDGTRKYLFKADKGFIESAFIPEKNRKTLL